MYKLNKKEEKSIVKALNRGGMSFYNKLCTYQPFLKSGCEGNIVFVEPKCCNCCL